MKSAQRILRLLILAFVICPGGLTSPSHADLAPPPEDGWESSDSHPTEPGNDTATHADGESADQTAPEENRNSLNLIVAGIAIAAALVAGFVVRQRKLAGGTTETFSV